MSKRLLLCFILAIILGSALFFSFNTALADISPWGCKERGTYEAFGHQWGICIELGVI